MVKPFKTTQIIVMFLIAVGISYALHLRDQKGIEIWACMEQMDDRSREAYEICVGEINAKRVP